MTGEKVIEALRLHLAQMEERFMSIPDNVVEARRCPEAVNTGDQIRHLKWMVGQSIGFVQEGRIDKAMRWLGFIQGALWAMHLVTIEESKRANMPEGEEFKA